MDLIVARFRGQVSNKINNAQPDINEQLRSLKESDVKVTFRDIWVDYWMYRDAYFYRYTFKETPEYLQPKKLEPDHKVDIENFSILKYMKDVIYFGQDANYGTLPFMLNKLLFFSAMLFGHMILSYPYAVYYHYKDPLLKDKDDSFFGVTSEATMRRLKYKQKQRNW